MELVCPPQVPTLKTSINRDTDGLQKCNGEGRVSQLGGDCTVGGRGTAVDDGTAGGDGTAGR